MDLQVKESMLERCQELEQTAKDQATDNAILDQLRKVLDFLQEGKGVNWVESSPKRIKCSASLKKFINTFR